jgi:hypothetical protein
MVGLMATVQCSAAGMLDCPKEKRLQLRWAPSLSTFRGYSTMCATAAVGYRLAFRQQVIVQLMSASSALPSAPSSSELLPSEGGAMRPDLNSRLRWQA